MALAPPSTSIGVYRRRRALVAAGAVAVLVAVASLSGGAVGSVIERVVDAGLLVGWVAAALALWSWDRARPPRRDAGSSEPCLSLEPASPVAA